MPIHCRGVACLNPVGHLVVGQPRRWDIADKFCEVGIVNIICCNHLGVKNQNHEVILTWTVLQLPPLQEAEQAFRFLLLMALVCLLVLWTSVPFAWMPRELTVHLALA